MSHQVNVYYMYCIKKEAYQGDYHIYQRKLADKMLNRGLKDIFQIDGTEKVIERAAYGKPYIKGKEQYQFNISNTNGMVVCGVSDVVIGVDVERERSFQKAVLRKCAASSEKDYILAGETAEQQSRFFQLWTLKESYVKMTGDGLRIPLKEVEFEIAQEKENGTGKITCSKTGKFYQHQKNAYWLSLCAKEAVNVCWIPLNFI